jgi:hypothetical protein
MQQILKVYLAKEVIMSGELNNVTTAAINNVISQKKAQKQDEALEMKGVEISREASGDNVQSSTTAGSTLKSSTTTAEQEVERVEKLDVSRSGQNIVEDAQKKAEEEKAKEENDALQQAVDQAIQQDWGEVGANEGK